ncbi:MAG: hypothetical protein P8I55_09290 [Crocinitomix sp.]|nr:hypothetical protein [Crocinitomix sp.]
MKHVLIPILISFVLFSFGGNEHEEEIINVLETDSTEQLSNNTIIDEDSIGIEDELIAVPADEYELTDLNENPSLKNYVDYLHEVMDDVESPIELVYEGVDFGDYFHLTFTGPDELYLDFGDANNDFGEYELYDPLTFEDNSKYVGKTFEVFWEFKASSFYCCEGEMESTTAEVPSIVQLKLME